LVLATADEDKPMLSCYISKELVDKKIKCRQVVRELGKYKEVEAVPSLLLQEEKCRQKGIKQGSRVREVVFLNRSITLAQANRKGFDYLLTAQESI
jgi:hypothetical protein